MNPEKKASKEDKKTSHLAFVSLSPSKAVSEVPKTNKQRCPRSIHRLSVYMYIDRQSNFCTHFHFSQGC